MSDEQARDIIENWLEDDNHGFAIPATEWGRSLLSALRTVMYGNGEVTENDYAYDVVAQQNNINVANRQPGGL